MVYHSLDALAARRSCHVRGGVVVYRCADCVDDFIWNGCIYRLLSEVLNIFPFFQALCLLDYVDLVYY